VINNFLTRENAIGSPVMSVRTTESRVFRRAVNGLGASIYVTTLLFVFIVYYRLA